MPAEVHGTIILAAGESRRFGSAKVVAPWQQTTLLGQAIATARAIGGSLLVVTGAHAAAATPMLDTTDSIYNEQWRDGMGGSAALGFRTLLDRHPQLRHVIIMTIDQPLTTSAHLQTLLAAAQATDKAALTSDGSHRGPPACVPARLFPKALSLTGERGLKSLLTDADITNVDNVEALRDGDTPQALAILARAAP